MAERPRGRNTYATPAPRPGGAAPNPSGEFIWGGPGRYSVPNVPDTTDPEYTLGFSPKLLSGGSPDGSELPDDIRTGNRQPAGPGRGGTYNKPSWRNRQLSDTRKRNTADHTEEMWKIRQEKPQVPVIPIQVQERVPIRPTATNSPTGYAFTRKWSIPRNIKDVLGEGAVAHFSMADHRRTYAIMTQKPQGRIGVNTYRAAPRPWDENLFVPPPAGHSPNGIAGNRAFRLS